MVAWERGSSRVSSDQDHHGEWSAGGWQSHSIWMGRNEEQGGEIHLLHCGPSSLGLPPPERPFELFLCLYTFPTASLTLVLHITGTVHHLVLPLSLCIYYQHNLPHSLLPLSHWFCISQAQCISLSLLVLSHWFCISLPHHCL